MQLIKDNETVEEVNTQLEKMYTSFNCYHAGVDNLSYPIHRGYNIGTRIVEEFLAKSGVTCLQKGNIKETAEIIAKVSGA